jgi:hypothetical protein
MASKPPYTFSGFTGKNKKAFDPAGLMPNIVS